MKYLKEYKLFESSKFVSKENVDALLDKINDSGIESLSDIDRNRLILFSEDDKKVIEIIDKMADMTLKFKDINHNINLLHSQGKSKEAINLFKTKWVPLNSKMMQLEREIEKHGIVIGDERLDQLMKRERPDAYNDGIFESKSNIRFVKKDRKKGAKTDVYDVYKNGNVIGQIKWYSRMRGYAFLPTPDNDTEIKEFVKELMRKRREDKKLNESNINSNYRIERVSDNSIKWFVGNRKCGTFDFIKDKETIYIRGYMKDIKSVDGYQFIKLSIELLLNSGIRSIISNGNRSIYAANVWRRLNMEDDYNIETIDRHFDGYISDRHSTKILTKSK